MGRAQMDGSYQDFTAHSYFYAGQKDAHHQDASRGKGGKKGVDAKPSTSACTSHPALWEAPGQQVCNLVSKKCSYLSILGVPVAHCQLPAKATGLL